MRVTRSRWQSMLLALALCGASAGGLNAQGFGGLPFNNGFQGPLHPGAVNPYWMNWPGYNPYLGNPFVGSPYPGFYPYGYAYSPYFSPIVSQYGWYGNPWWAGAYNPWLNPQLAGPLAGPGAFPGANPFIPWQPNQPFGFQNQLNQNRGGVFLPQHIPPRNANIADLLKKN